MTPLLLRTGSRMGTWPVLASERSGEVCLSPGEKLEEKTVCLVLPDAVWPGSVGSLLVPAAGGGRPAEARSLTLLSH